MIDLIEIAKDCIGRHGPNEDAYVAFKKLARESANTHDAFEPNESAKRTEQIKDPLGFLRQIFEHVRDSEKFSDLHARAIEEGASANVGKKLNHGKAVGGFDRYGRPL